MGGTARAVIGVLLLLLALGFLGYLLTRDSDGDGLPDWRDPHPHIHEFADSDKDGLRDVYEIEIETDPNNPDTDGDGVFDGEEVNKYGTDPKNPDSDGDKLIDGEEIFVYHTDPLDEDTDDDGWLDYEDIDPTTKNAYENIKERVGEDIAAYLARCWDKDQEDVKKAAEYLKVLNDEERKALVDSGVLAEITEDGKLDSAELGFLNDVDKDGISNADDPIPVNPLNDFDRSFDSKVYAIKLAYYNKDNSETVVDRYGKDSLKLTLDTIDQNSWVIENFGPFECHLYTLEAKYCPFLYDHPFATRALVFQIRDVCYENKVHEVEGEDALWQLVGKAVKPIDELEDEGKINCLDLEDLKDYQNEDVSKEEWVGQVLFPDWFMDVNIKEELIENWLAGDYVNDFRYSYTPQEMYECLKENVTYDPELGTSPNEWIIDHLREEYEQNIDKWIEEYKNGEGWWKTNPIVCCYDSYNIMWPNCCQSFHNSFDEWLEKCPEAVYVRGKVYLLQHEVFAGECVSILARAFGLAGFSEDTLYPDSEDTWHSEPLIITKDGSSFGLWADKNAFVLDSEKPLYIYVSRKRREVQLPNEQTGASFAQPELKPAQETHQRLMNKVRSRSNPKVAPYFIFPGIKRWPLGPRGA